MLCITAFVIFLIFFPILGIFPGYRKLFRRAWQCVFKKVTGQPCDINLGEELKNQMLGKLMFRFPKFTKFLDKTFSFWAILFVILNVWSLVYAANSALNLWVYDTCDPSSGESCSLSGDACGVASSDISLEEAIKTKKLDTWVTQPFKTLGQTLERVPNRVKTWDAKEYLGPTNTYYKPFDSSKPTALEMIDPGCTYCKKLFENIKESKFYDKYNLTYLVYPIPDAKNTYNDGYKFQSSIIIAKYLEAVKKVPLSQPTEIPPDWQLLEKIYTETTPSLGDLQYQYNFYYSKKDLPAEIEKKLSEIGYSDEQIATIRDISKSAEVQQSLDAQKNIVENKVKTIRIPTIIFNGRRYDRLVDVDKLK